jgi:carbamoyl-phosphate synthase large subunit
MGIEFKFPMAFAKAQIVANQKLPLPGTLFLTLNDFTKPNLPAIANGFIELGFIIVATTGTTNLLKMEGIPVDRVLKP